MAHNIPQYPKKKKSFVFLYCSGMWNIWDTEKWTSAEDSSWKLFFRAAQTSSGSPSQSLTRSAALPLFFLKQLYSFSLFLWPSLPLSLLLSTSSRQRADAAKHFPSPRSYFLSLGIHFLPADTTIEVRAFLRNLSLTLSLSVTHTPTHTYPHTCVCTYNISMDFTVQMSEMISIFW